MFGIAKKQEAIEYCERCAQVCDRNCRAESAREQAFSNVARFGGRV